MATYNQSGTGLRIVGLLLVIAVLLAGGTLLFDYLGLVDATQLLAPLRRQAGLAPRTPQEALDDPLLLERERLNKQSQALDLLQEELARRDRELADDRAELDQMVATVQEQADGLEEREKAFNQRMAEFENRRVNLEQNARYLNGMPPASAVAILLEMTDTDIIDLFAMTEELAVRSGTQSVVGFWLSQMPAERAAVLQRKMTLRSVATGPGTSR